MAARPLCAVVLAAGEGTRMRSSTPKPLHRLCGRPMVLHVLDALAELPLDHVVAVVGHGGEWVTKALVEHAPSDMRLDFVEQVFQRGTADALAVGLTALPADVVDEDGDVLVLPGDTPLVRAATLAALVRHHRASEAAATLLVARVGDTTGYDVVVRSSKDGSIVAVVEDESATEAERQAGEVATAIHCFRLGVLAPALRRLRPLERNGEASLTGLYAVLASAGYRVESFMVGDPTEAAGVNDRAQLAAAEAELRDRINERWMRRGVTMWDPEHTYVGAEVLLAPDVVLLPGVVLEGSTRVAAGAEIGPYTHLIDTEVGERAIVRQSWGERALIGARARVGPFAALGPGTVVDDGEVLEAFSRRG
jgi:bifunctional UDP-N-acetylglucosamine pyrophosphorylase/glucosamine-1-phosphate N-acetyltransferase